MGLFCLDRRALAGSVDLDRALWDKLFVLGPSCLLLVCDVNYMQEVMYTSGKKEMQVLILGLYF